jgi:phospholipase C
MFGAAALSVLGGASSSLAATPSAQGPATATPIKHVVVIYSENESFDHYFATYPYATNTDGTTFTPSKKTPKDIDNLRTAGLLKTNPNQYPPQRLSPSQALTCDQNHSYTPEQKAYDGGKADKFVQYTNSGTCSGNLYGAPGLVMDYYDGNTVTGLWNYAQHYALSDNSWDATYGPSTPGALNLISGQTHGVISTDPNNTEDPKQTSTPASFVASPNAQGVGTLNGDNDPAFDDCSNNDHTGTGALAEMTGKNVGDLLNAKGVSWGWFQGGFAPTTSWDGKQGDFAKCAAAHANIGGNTVRDYVPHHNPFEYYKSTANPHHLPPKDLAEVGHNGQANHNYDVSWFNKAAQAGDLPSVSFVKPPAYENAHPGNSDPIDEQHFLTSEIDQIQKSPEWSSTAVIIAYDDSDGWYDHAYVKPFNGSTDASADQPACQAGPAPAGGYEDRCAPGARLPMLVISPYSKVNYVDHTDTIQPSITKFIEDNWNTGRIGDSSFDATAGTLTNMFDFKHPNDEQVLLRQNGGVASVKHFPASWLHGNTGTTLRAENSAYGTSLATPTGSASFGRTVGIAAGAAVVATAGGVLIRRRRRSARAGGTV